MRLDCAKRFGRFAGEREVYLRNSMETNKNGLDVIFWGGRFFFADFEVCDGARTSSLSGH